MDTDLWSVDLPATTADPEFPGMEAPRDEAWGLVGSWGGDDGPIVVLNGHIDVVPTGGPDLWTTDPWSGEVRDGRVLGRGACDMKAGLACQLLAVEALRAAGVPLRGRVALQSVVGEEDGGLGTFATLRRGHGGDLAVICEPTSRALVTASAGALTFRLTVPGRSVHATMRPAGVDAVDKYLLVHAALRRLEAERNRDVAAADGALRAALPAVRRHAAGRRLAEQRPRLRGRRGPPRRRARRAGRAPARRWRRASRRSAPTTRGWPRTRCASSGPAGSSRRARSTPGSPVARLVSSSHARLHGARPRCTASRTARTCG